MVFPGLNGRPNHDQWARVRVTAGIVVIGLIALSGAALASGRMPPFPGACAPFSQPGPIWAGGPLHGHRHFPVIGAARRGACGAEIPGRARCHGPAFWGYPLLFVAPRVSVFAEPPAPPIQPRTWRAGDPVSAPGFEVVAAANREHVARSTAAPGSEPASP